MYSHLLFINLSTSYPKGYGILTAIALVILGYLLYALFKPEKF